MRLITRGAMLLLSSIIFVLIAVSAGCEWAAMYAARLQKLLQDKLERRSA